MLPFKRNFKQQTSKIELIKFSSCILSSLRDDSFNVFPNVKSSSNLSEEWFSHFLRILMQLSSEWIVEWEQINSPRIRTFTQHRFSLPWFFQSKVRSISALPALGNISISPKKMSKKPSFTVHSLSNQLCYRHNLTNFRLWMLTQWHVAKAQRLCLPWYLLANKETYTLGRPQKNFFYFPPS